MREWIGDIRNVPVSLPIRTVGENPKRNKDRRLNFTSMKRDRDKEGNRDRNIDDYREKERARERQRQKRSLREIKKDQFGVSVGKVNKTRNAEKNTVRKPFCM